MVLILFPSTIRKKHFRFWSHSLVVDQAINAVSIVIPCNCMWGSPLRRNGLNHVCMHADHQLLIPSGRQTERERANKGLFNLLLSICTCVRLSCFCVCVCVCLLNHLLFGCRIFCCPFVVSFEICFAIPSLLCPKSSNLKVTISFDCATLIIVTGEMWRDLF